MNILIHNVTPSSRRLRRYALWVWMTLWLLLNAQWALASHRCEPQALPHTVSQSSDLSTSPDDSSELHSVKSDAVCQLHCDGQTAQIQVDNLSFLPLTSTELTLVNYTACISPLSLTDSLSFAEGPPAEIRLCRFRE